MKRVASVVVLAAMMVGAGACTAPAEPDVPEGVIVLAREGQNGLTTNGIFQNGIFQNGIFQNGIFQNGIFQNGIFQNGIFQNGIFQNGIFQNGIFQNGILQNGIFQNALWQNDLAAKQMLLENPYTETFLKYLYGCTMPAGAHKDLVVDDKTVELKGAIGLWPTWARDGSTCDPNTDCATKTAEWIAAMPTVLPDTCDVSCQRWLSACMLARTNAYGIPVAISLRAPNSAPAGIQLALQVTDEEKLAFPKREGSFYGNLFLSESAGTLEPTQSAPQLYACAGPVSNVPDITKRFCSSQGNRGPIEVTGTCEEKCAGLDVPEVGAMQTCTTSDGTEYPEVITAYVKDLIEVCGNAVCETREDVSGTCPSDCHPGAWATSFAAGNIDTLGTSDTAFAANKVVTSAVDADGNVVLVGVTTRAREVDLGGPLVGDVNSLESWEPYLVFTKYQSAAPGTFVSGRRITLPSSGSSLVRAEIRTIAAGADGSIAVAVSVTPIGSNERLLIGKLAADGTPLWWSKTATTSASRQFVTDVEIDHHGNVILGGGYHSELSFLGPEAVGAPEVACKNGLDDDDDGAADDGCVVTLPFADPVPPGQTGDALVAKLAAINGSPLWAVGLDAGSAEALQVNGLAIDPSDDVVVAMYDAGPIDEATGVLKLRGSNGQRATRSDGTLWGVQGDSFYDVIADSQGDVYAIGTYTLPPELFAAPAPGAHRTDFFVAKFDGDDAAPLGAVSARRVCPDGESCDPLTGWFLGLYVSLDPAGNVLVSAWGPNDGSGVGIDFGAGPFFSWGKPDFYLASYTPDLQFRWAKHVPIVLDGNGHGLSFDKDGRIVTSGTYAGSMVIEDRLLINSNPLQPTSTNTFLASIGVPPPDDHSAPELIEHVPDIIVLDATSPDGATGWYMPPTAQDDGNAGTNVSCIPAPNSVFPIADTTVTCWARDPAGNTPPLPETFIVRVVDRLGPAFTTATGPFTAEAIGPSGAPVSYVPPSALDQVHGPRPVTCTPDSGSIFPVGTSPVICRSDDGAADGPNISSTGLLITVTDTREPVISVPTSVSHLPGGIVTWTISATDLVDGSVPVKCSPESGSVFNTGETNVQCTASDAHENTATATFVVVVTADTLDRTPPVITVPPDITVSATSAAGAWVDYSVSATDLVDGSVTPQCTPAPGTFPFGTTKVTCTATDAASNTTTGAFYVNVRYPWSGVLQPLNADGSSTFKLGSTVPVKFQLTGVAGGITNAVATLSLFKLSSQTTGTDMEPVSNGNSDSGNVFRYDATSGQYIYNLSTKPLSVGTWRLRIELGDGVVRTVDFSLRK